MATSNLLFCNILPAYTHQGLKVSSLFHLHGFRCKQYCRVFKIILCLGEDIMNVGLWDGFYGGGK